MAEHKSEAAAQGGEASAGKRKLPIKSVIVVVALMAAEAIAVVAFLKMTGPKPAEAHADAVHVHSNADEETVEIAIAEDKFQNLQTGRVWIWDTSVYVQVKQKNAEMVKKELERRNAEIKQGISEIISRAQHAQLKEPERQTLNRQITAFLSTIFQKEGEAEPMIERVLIPKCRGFPADF